MKSLLSLSMLVTIVSTCYGQKYQTITIDADAIKARVYANDKSFNDPTKMNTSQIDYSIGVDTVFYVHIKNSEKNKLIELTCTDQTNRAKADTISDPTQALSLNGRDFLLFHAKFKLNNDNHTKTTEIEKEVVKGDGSDQKKVSKKDTLVSDPKIDTVEIDFYVERDAIPNPSFVQINLIKSIAGKIPKDELVDILIKLNYGPGKRFFSMMGADVSLNNGNETDSSESKSGVFRLNEAVANVNWNLYKTKNHVTHGELLGNRCLFLGTGVKVFNSITYVGGHFGSIETDGFIFGSYIYAGYYYSPYINGVKTTNDSVNLFRHNVYVEAAVNIPIVKDVPLRIKFGLMLPIAAENAPGKQGDMVNPAPKDIISRLSLEAPLGGILKFW